MFSLKTLYFLNEKVANFPPGGDVMQTSWRLPLQPQCCTMCDKIIMSVRQLDAAQLQPSPCSGFCGRRLFVVISNSG